MKDKIMKDKIIKRTQEYKDFSGIYDGYLDKTLCNKVIDLYKKQEEFNKVFVRNSYHAVTKNMVDDTSSMIEKNNIHEFSHNELNFITINFKQALDHYVSQTSILEYHKPFSDLCFTDIKIQKTSPGQGYHAWHVEKIFNNHTVSRFLAFTIYLNEVEGGETEFLHQKIRVQPKIGRIAIWPAFFPYVHRGNPPLDKEKFIVTSWLLLK
jgi:hypothetical protein